MAMNPALLVIFRLIPEPERQQKMACWFLPAMTTAKLFGGSWRNALIPQIKGTVSVPVAAFAGKGEAVVIPGTISFDIVEAITIEAWAMISP